MSARRQN